MSKVFKLTKAQKQGLLALQAEVSRVQGEVAEYLSGLLEDAEEDLTLPWRLAQDNSKLEVVEDAGPSN